VGKLFSNTIFGHGFFVKNSLIKYFAYLFFKFNKINNLNIY